MDVYIQRQKEYNDYLYTRIISELSKLDNPQLLLCARLSMDIGLRLAETYTLKWEQIDFKNTALINVVRKNDILFEKIEINNDIVDILNKLIAYRIQNNIDDEGCLFLNKIITILQEEEMYMHGQTK